MSMVIRTFVGDNMIRLKHLLELVTRTRIECDACGWSWKIADGGSDLYVCHRCGHDNAPHNVRLKEPLAEITMGSIAPYATQFTWESIGNIDDAYEARFSADGIEIVFTMMHGGEGEWYFAFLMPSAQTNAWSSGRTTSHEKSGAVGQINYLRLIRTAGEAIIDFCTTHAPEAINISGADSNTDKELQKTRLYAAFVRDNAARLSVSGYTTMQRGDQLWLVRKNTADATGVSDS